MPIYDKNGNIMSSDKAPTRPLRPAPILKSNRMYIASGLTPEKIGPVFREADRGNISRQAQLFEQIREHDAHVLSEDDKRINAITSQYLDWQFTPATDSQRDLDVVNFLEKNVLDHDDWIKYKKSQQTAVGRGYAGLAPEWDRSEGQAVVVNFGFVEHKRLLFQDPITGYLRDWPLLATDENPQGIEIHKNSLFLHKYGGLAGNAARSGVFRPVTWMVVFKHFSIKDWWVFSELCGIPLRMGIYQSSTSDEDREQLKAAVEKIGNDYSATISNDTEIRFEQVSARVSGGELWEKQSNFCNNEISKAIVGSSAFSEAGKSGSYALHTLETGVRADITLSDAQETAATDIDQWIKPLVSINFGPETPLPKFRAVFKKQEDLKTKSEWLEKAVDRVGGQVPLSWYLEQYGIPELQDGDRTVIEISPPVTAKIHAKNGIKKLEQDAVNDQKQIDRLVDRAGAEVDLKDNEEAILSLISEANSYEDIYSGLLELYQEISIDGMQDVLQRALLMAQAAGIASVEAK